MDYYFMVIRINCRTDKAPGVQKILTRYGCIIRMRLGLHDTNNNCREEGIILLRLEGDQAEFIKLEKELNEIDGVKAKSFSI